MNNGVEKVFNEIQSADPDVVLLQEADGIALSIAAYLDWYVYNSSASTAIISPYPITEVFQDQSSNSFIGARIQLSSNPIKDVIVWSIHLGPYPYGPYEICFAGVTDSTELVLIDSLSGRLPQINSLVSTMTQYIAKRTVSHYLLGVISILRPTRIILPPLHMIIADPSISGLLRKC